MEKLTLTMAFIWLGQMKPKDFFPLDSCLATTVAFDNLKEAIVVYTGPVTVSRVKAKIDKLLPSLAKKAILHVLKIPGPDVRNINHVSTSNRHGLTLVGVASLLGILRPTWCATIGSP